MTQKFEIDYTDMINALGINVSKSELYEIEKSTDESVSKKVKSSNIADSICTTLKIPKIGNRNIILKFLPK